MFRQTDKTDPALIEAFNRLILETTAVKNGLTNLAGKIQHRIMPNSPESLFLALCDDALASTVEIVKSQMKTAMLFMEVTAFHRYCLSKAPITGAHCEFGVFSGQTLNFFAEQRPDTHFDGFDSFEGLPEEWTGYLRFDFNRGKQVPVVRDNVNLHVGWFSDTLGPYLKTIDHISFLHIDCDLYSSTSEVLTACGSFFRAGTVIIFDEYFCYPNYENHELKAFEEFLTSSEYSAEWIAVCGQRAACVLQRK